MSESKSRCKRSRNRFENQMTYATEKPNSTSLAITVTVPRDEFEKLFARAAERISRDVEIDGFRKGKAPYDVVKQKLGEMKILEEAVRLHAEAHLTEVIHEIEEKEYRGKSFEPVGAPAMTITKLVTGADAEYRILLTLLPPITLPDYKKIAREALATKKIPEVTPEEMERGRNWLIESRARLITVDRAAALGDRVEIDFSTTLAGVPIEGGASKNHPFILGQGKFVPGFEDAVVGMTAGEEKTFILDVPANFGSKAIAGKKVVFTVIMRLVQARELPNWNDDFARSLGNFSSREAVEKNIHDGLLLEKEGHERERARMSAIERIADATRVEIPGVLIERELERMFAELESSIARMGLEFDAYLANIKKTKDGLRLEWQKDAERRVKIALALREIARAEKIQPSDEEIQQAINRVIAERGMSEKDVLALDREAFFDYNRGIARNEKVFKFLEALA